MDRTQPEQQDEYLITDEGRSKNLIEEYKTHYGCANLFEPPTGQFRPNNPSYRWLRDIVLDVNLPDVLAIAESASKERSGRKSIIIAFHIEKRSASRESIVRNVSEEFNSDQDVPSKPKAMCTSITHVRSDRPSSVGVLSTKDSSDSEEEDLFFQCRNSRPNTWKISCVILATDQDSLYSYKGMVSPSSKSQIIEFKIYSDSKAYMEATPAERWKIATIRGTVVTSTKEMAKSMNEESKLVSLKEKGKLERMVTPLELVGNKLFKDGIRACPRRSAYGLAVRVEDP